MQEEKKETLQEKDSKMAIQSTTLKVYNPDDFIYKHDLGSGAFGKVRKCLLKQGYNGRTLNNQGDEDSQNDST